MFEAVEGMLAEHAELETRLAAPETHADARLAKRLNQRYAALSSIIDAYREWQQLGDDIEAARELAAEDPEDAAFAEEAEALGPRRHEAEERLRRLLVPRDPADDKDAILVFSVGGGDAERKVSVNLMKAIDEAKAKKAKVFGIVGRDSGYTAKTGDLVVVIPPVDPGLITPHSEAFQAVVWHCLVSHPALQVMKTKW